MAWPASTFITFKLTPTDNGTLVELFHHGFERLCASAATEHESYEAGWNNQHVMALKKIVEAN